MVICNLARILFERRVKLKTLHNLTGLSYSTLWRLKENRSSTISIRAIDSICRELDVRVDQLISYKADEGSTSATAADSENGKGKGKVSRRQAPVSEKLADGG